MRIRLTFASDEELMRRCQFSLRLGVVFFPSSRLPEPGTPCDVDFNLRNEGVVLRTRGLIVGASSIEDDGNPKQGMWIRIVELSFVEPRLEPWLDSIGASSLFADAIPQPKAAARGTGGQQEAARTPVPKPSSGGASAGRPLRLPDPEKDDDLDWLSGNIRSEM